MMGQASVLTMKILSGQIRPGIGGGGSQWRPQLQMLRARHRDELVGAAKLFFEVRRAAFEAVSKGSI